jgi:ketose-bisphosphate aldolase
MPITSLKTMLADARRGQYAVCYCESWNLESTQAVVEAAEELRSPVIAGFNGGFLRHVRRAKAENLAWYASLRGALEGATVPVAFLLNESDDLEQIREGIELGFNAVMPENEGLGHEEHRTLVREVVALARPRDVLVEAQIGVLPMGGGHSSGHGSLTDPDLAYRFVAETGIDALAVSVGNIHILTEGKAEVDYSLLERLRERVDIPLVIHGGTGLGDETMAKMVRLGAAKFNFGTRLKQAYLEAVRTALGRYHVPQSPHEYLGIGGPEDIMIAGRDAVKEDVKKLLRICGSENRVTHDFSTVV